MRRSWNNWSLVNSSEEQYGEDGYVGYSGINGYRYREPDEMLPEFYKDQEESKDIEI